MTATEELRSMLDERGVEWWDSSDDNVLHTTWNDMNCWFNEFPDGWTAWGMAKRGTPEQAIAATLGAGTCHATSNPPVPKHWTGCSNCGSVWDFFYNICGYMGPPNFCPKCGAKVVDT